MSKDMMAGPGGGALKENAAQFLEKCLFTGGTLSGACCEDIGFETPSCHGHSLLVCAM